MTAERILRQGAGEKRSKYTTAKKKYGSVNAPIAKAAIFTLWAKNMWNTADDGQTAPKNLLNTFKDNP